MKENGSEALNKTEVLLKARIFRGVKNVLLFAKTTLHCGVGLLMCDQTFIARFPGDFSSSAGVS